MKKNQNIKTKKRCDLMERTQEDKKYKKKIKKSIFSLKNKKEKCLMMRWTLKKSTFNIICLFVFWISSNKKKERKSVRDYNQINSDPIKLS